MDVLNNREWATIVWLFIILIFFSSSPKMNKERSSFGEVVKTAFAGVLVRFYCINLLYVIVLVGFLYSIGFWQTHQIKSTLFWFFSVGLYSAFQVEKIKQDNNYWKRLVFDSFKLIAILQFIINIQSLNFFFELFIIPISFIIVLASEISKRDEKLAVISKITNFVLCTIGLTILIYALYSIVASIGKIDIEKVVYDFATPPVLTLLFLPFLFILMLHSSFGTAFRKVDNIIEKPFLRLISKALALILFNVRLELVDRWGNHLNISKPKSFKDIRKSFETISYMKHAEKNQKIIQENDGWSPYIAKEFLSDIGISTGYYHPSFDEWVAYSSPVEFGEELLPHNISYYVEGTKDVAKTLKLKLNVFNSNSADEALSYLSTVATTLYQKATGKILPENLSESILKGNNKEIKDNGTQVSVLKDLWVQHAYNGFDIKFVIIKI